MAEDDLRRRFPRISAENVVLVKSLGDEELEEFAKIRTMGMGGCGFMSAEPLGRGSVLDLLISVDRNVVNSRARVVYQQSLEEGGYEIGVEFIDLNDSNRELIQRMFPATDEPDAPVPQADMTPERILKLGLGFWPAKVVMTAVEIGVFTLLARGPIKLHQLIQSLGIHSRGSRDFFDALVSLGLLDRENGLYSNAPDAGLFLDREKSSYVGGLLEMANRRSYRFWDGLGEALRTGEPQNELRESGEDQIHAIHRDSESTRSFVRAMSGISAGSAEVIARAFDWKNHRVFADLGCAEGEFGVRIAAHYEHLHGVGLDLPQVQPWFDAHIAARGLSTRLRFQAGNFFVDPLPEADVYVLGHILHSINHDQRMTLLTKVHGALPNGGAIIIYDTILDDDRRKNTFGLLMSLNMLIETREGAGYTETEGRQWMLECGFRDVVIAPLAGSDSMLTAIK